MAIPNLYYDRLADSDDADILYLFFKKSKKTKKNAGQSNVQKINGTSHLSEAYKKLLIACEKNDLKSIQAALLQWGSCYCGNTIHSLGELSRCLNDKAITIELQTLEKCLYAQHDMNTPWQADSLVSLIKALSSPTEKKQVSDKALKKLYPDM